jgi:hypothetical protein
MEHERYERLIDQLILHEGGRLAPPAWQELRAHLTGCAPCRERYNRVALAERMLHGGPLALSSPSPASFDSAVARPPAWRRALGWLAPPQRWAVGVVALAAMAVLIPFSMRAPHGEFQARGGTATERTAGLRAFCLGESGVTPQCTRASQLRLTVSNAGRFKYVFVVGLDDARAIKWYAPRPPATESVPAPAGVDVPVGDAVRLGVNHDPGAVRIYAIFSDAPVSAPEIEAAVAQLEKVNLPTAAANALPLTRTDVVQRSVSIDVAP